MDRGLFLGCSLQAERIGSERSNNIRGSVIKRGKIAKVLLLLLLRLECPLWCVLLTDSVNSIFFCPVLRPICAKRRAGRNGGRTKNKKRGKKIPLTHFIIRNLQFANSQLTLLLLHILFCVRSSSSLTTTKPQLKSVLLKAAAAAIPRVIRWWYSAFISCLEFRSSEALPNTPLEKNRSKSFNPFFQVWMRPPKSKWAKRKKEKGIFLFERKQGRKEKPEKIVCLLPLFLHPEALWGGLFENKLHYFFFRSLHQQLF